MVEAVILLPVFAVILSGIAYVQAYAMAEQGARVAARRCAWEHAMNGCDEIPAGCGEHGHSAESTGAGPDESDASTAADAAAVVDGVIAASSNSGLPFALPLIGPALEGLFGSATQFTVTREVRVGGYATSAKGHFYLLCNAKPTSPAEAIKSAFCEATPLCD